MLILVRPEDETPTALDALKAAGLTALLIEVALDDGAVLVEVFSREHDWQTRFTPRDGVEAFDQSVVAVALDLFGDRLKALSES